MSTSPDSKTEILSQKIWNNKFITIDQKMVYLCHWHRARTNKISDLFDEHDNRFLPFLFLRNKYTLNCNFSDLFDEHDNRFLPFLFLRNKYTLNCNFLQYHGLISAVPQSWKKLLHVNSGDSATPLLPICTITCKMLYDKRWPLKISLSPLQKKKTLIIRYRKRESKKIFCRSKPQKKLN